MERRPYPHKRNSGLGWPLTIAVVAANVAIGVKGFVENNNESHDQPPATITPAVDTLTATPSPTPSETPVPTLDGIPLPIYPSATPTSSPTRIRIPDQNHEQSMQATGTKAAAEAKLDTFEPDLGFTRDDFEKIQASTFLVYGIIESGFNMQATAWVIGKDGSTYYLATAGHVGKYFQDNGAKLEIFRPGIDHERYHDDTVMVAINANSDIAILKIEVEIDESVAPANPIPHMSNFETQTGLPIMAVGFPGVLTTDTVVTGANISTMYRMPQPDLFFAYGSTSGGASGSPIVVKNDEGTLVAVGVLSYEYSADAKIGETMVQTQNAILGTLLQFQDLEFH